MTRSVGPGNYYTYDQYVQTQDTYTYDSLGNIINITDKDGKQRRYTYDQRNQLIREEDEASGRTVSYTYDHGGNLLRAEISEKNGTSAYTDTYTYDTIWTDKLTGYNGKAITYDASGNPLEYLGNTFTWKDGRKLESITKPDGSVITYTYDSEGNRIGKQIRKADGTEEKTTYYWDGGKLLREVSGDETLYYSYDSNGKLWSMDWEKGDTKKGYFVIRNAQGDITGLYHLEDSSLAGSYTYDAWGQLLSVNPANESDEEILRKNPFRYRGYYYDEESGYYFLQSCYYNPEVRRFLNADTLVEETGDDIGYNLFAYCGNNPVNKSDESGHCAIAIEQSIAVCGVAAVEIGGNNNWFSNISSGSSSSSCSSNWRSNLYRGSNCQF